MSTEQTYSGDETGWQPDLRKFEALGLLALTALAVFFVWVSWRKWPDPLVDCGLQWYGFWRLSHGGVLYHDVNWNYGPLAAYFNAGLFRVFGPGMMVLVAANLVQYVLLAALAYVAFRKAWGRFGAFTALAVFISVFSFSRLNSIGNYNFATPYAQESAQGMLLLLVTLFIAVWWARGVSRTAAFLLGLCGGLAAVLKPEFMLAGGVLGAAAFLLRRRQRHPVQLPEFWLVLAGIILPALAFTAGFAMVESWGSALVDANRAWWNVVGNKTERSNVLQQTFMGLDHPSANALTELNATGLAIAGIGAIWAAGWMLTRPWPLILRLALAAAAAVVAYYCAPAGGWIEIGSSLPGLMLIVLVVLAARLVRELWQRDYTQESTVMAAALALAAAVMLLRMALQARIHHFGFYQAALAGMVVAAFMVTDVPRWIRSGGWGRFAAAAGCFIALAVGCGEIAWQSTQHMADQTVEVGTGRDRFYADAKDINATGWLVNWTVDQLAATPPKSTVCVLTEGFMVNYLLRRESPMTVFSSEDAFLRILYRHPPDYVVFISRDLSEYGIEKYAATNGPGYKVLLWLQKNRYPILAEQGGNPLVSRGEKGVVILRRNTAEPATTPEQMTRQ